MRERLGSRDVKFLTYVMFDAGAILGVLLVLWLGVLVALVVAVCCMAFNMYRLGGVVREDVKDGAQ